MGSLFQRRLPGDSAGCRVESPGGTTLTSLVLPGPDFSCVAFVPGASSSIDAQTLYRAASVAASPESDSRLAAGGNAHAASTRQANALGVSTFATSTAV